MYIFILCAVYYTFLYILFFHATLRSTNAYGASDAPTRFIKRNNFILRGAHTKGFFVAFFTLAESLPPIQIPPPHPPLPLIMVEGERVAIDSESALRIQEIGVLDGAS